MGKIAQGCKGEIYNKSIICKSTDGQAAEQPSGRPFRGSRGCKGLLVHDFTHRASSIRDKTLNTVTDTPQVLTSLSGTPKQTYFTPHWHRALALQCKASASSGPGEGGRRPSSLCPLVVQHGSPDREGAVDTVRAGGDNGSV